MSRSAPIHVLWWLVSRASGVVALLLIALTVLIGLVMAAKVIRRPGLKRSLVRLHEHVALVALAAICVHGLALLPDRWLKPGLRGIAVPFALSYRPALTGVGIIAGYLALLLGPSFYLRRRIGARRWRKLHRATVLIWGLSAVHAIGAGSDGGAVWLRCVVLAPLVPIVYLLVLRSIGARPAAAAQRSAASSTERSAPTGAARREKPHSQRAPIESAPAASAVAIIPASGTVRAKNLRVPGISRATT